MPTILKVANVHFTQTGNNRLEYTGNGVVRLTANGIQVPVGTSATRPTGEAGIIRFNTTTGNFEGHNASGWGAIGGEVDLSPAFNQANTAYNQANAAYDRANTRVSSVSGTSGRITSTGGPTPTLDLATAGSGAASYSSGISALTVDAYGRVTAVTGSANYTPTNGSGATGTWGISISGTAANATQLGGVAAASYMRTNSAQTVSARHLFSSSQSVGSLLLGSANLGGFEVLGGGGGNASFIGFHRPGVYAAYFGIDTDNQFAVGGWSAGSGLASFKTASLGVGTAASGVGGEIRATNNITAYFSDKRLKTDIKKIDGALAKVQKITGVTFVSNDKAKEHGYTDERVQVGVLAQDVEKVLPQVVVPAPFDIGKNEDGTEYSISGENYKTVQYEKLIPLLIEAIKEQQDQIDSLKQELEELKRK